MKRADLNQQIEDGQPCAIVEFRNAVARLTKFRDDKSGRNVEYVSVTYNVETGQDALKISEKVEGMTDPDKWQCPFKKGERVVWVVKSMAYGDRGMRCAGQLLKLEQ